MDMAGTAGEVAEWWAMSFMYDGQRVVHLLAELEGGGRAVVGAYEHVDLFEGPS